MSIFNFHVADTEPSIATEQIDLETQAEARAMALRYASTLLRDMQPSFWLAGEMVLTVSDACNLTLFTITIFTTEAAAAGGASLTSLPELT